MENTSTKLSTIDFPIRTSLPDICPYNPNCPDEIINSIIGHLSQPLQEIVRYLFANHQSDEFTVSKDVDELGIPIRKLERMFNQELTFTPNECLEQIRIYHVYKQLNENPFLRIKDAFYKAGFKSRAAFEYVRKKYPLR